jgi:hypothetical protein
MLWLFLIRIFDQLYPISFLMQRSLLFKVSNLVGLEFEMKITFLIFWKFIWILETYSTLDVLGSFFIEMFFFNS